jgi:hypothetical protein
MLDCGFIVMIAVPLQSLCAAKKKAGRNAAGLFARCAFRITK